MHLASLRCPESSKKILMASRVVFNLMADTSHSVGAVLRKLNVIVLEEALNIDRYTVRL